jgi:hypothetical protein
LARSYLLTAATAAIFAISVSAQAQFAHLVLQSEQGDFIGQGQNWDIWYTPNQPGSDFFSHVVLTNGGGPSYIYFIVGKVTGGSDNTYSNLDFGTNQLNLPLVPGSYLNAERAPFASSGHPGLDVSFQNRGSNTLTGSFNVTDFTYDFDQATDTYTILSFKANFIQHSEGQTPALTGTFTYNAVPEPASLAALGIGALAMLRKRKKIRN